MSITEHTLNTIDPNTPILVGAASVMQRLEEPNSGKEAYQLMVDASRAAAEDAGCPALLEQIERIYVPEGIWKYSDPGRLVGQAVGSPAATTILGQVGILQQTLIGDACDQIARGEIEVALVTGGEAKFRRLRGQIAGVMVSETTQEDVFPDIELKPQEELWNEAEINAGLYEPVGLYAIMESALRAQSGESIDKHRDRIANLYQRFSEIAADNPHAWKREIITAATIRNSTTKNPMIAFPYTKMHNTSWNVDQASGLLFVSAAKAESMGISRKQWMFPLVSTESNYMLTISQREQLHRSPGARLAAEKALEVTGLKVEEIDFWDLYSCFPVAVQIYALEARIPQDKDLTITGGMPFAGGPFNNYVLQATVRMIEILRDNPGSIGMVSSVSGFITKQAWGVWSTEPGRGKFAFVDVSDEVKSCQSPKEVESYFDGEGSITGYTVLYKNNEPERAVAVIDIAGGKRTVAFNDDIPVMSAMMHEDHVGYEVHVAAGRFELILAA